MWEPREKSQRVLGRDREAGWEARMGTSKKVSDSMPPEPIRLAQVERMRVVLTAGEAMANVSFVYVRWTGSDCRPLMEDCVSEH